MGIADGVLLEYAYSEALWRRTAERDAGCIHCATSTFGGACILDTGCRASLQPKAAPRTGIDGSQ